ncbi:MAG TPA: UvrB/UvrC motif-containing protein, partial [Pirellulaceae bacterium]
RRYDRAVLDARHTLKLMDLCRETSPSEAWTVTHEQYRPFVIYHRIYAEALGGVGDEKPQQAIELINLGIQELEQALADLGTDENDDDEMVARLQELREDLRERFEVGPTLQEQLAEAIQSEQYELAARLRDQISKYQRPTR